MTEYDALGLDQLLELSRSDAEHAGDMAEQARVLREMAGDLTDKVDLMRGVMTALFDTGDVDDAPWSGKSAEMMRTELDRLFTSAGSAPQVLEDNAKAMDDFGSRVHATLVEIDQLHVSSNGGQNQADVDKARQVMQEANSGYLATADQMPEPKFYNGLRKSADGTPGSWTEQHGATPTGDASTPVYSRPASEPVPTVAYDGQPDSSGEPDLHAPADTEPLLQGPGPTAPTVTPNPSLPPVTPSPGGPPTGPGLNPWVPPVGPRPGDGSRPPQPIGTKPTQPVGTRPPPPVGSRPPAITPRPITPSIIGPTRPTAIPPRPPVPVVPNPNGTVPPVIGTRPGTPITPVPVQPNASNPTGTVRPVIGTRPGAPVTPVPVQPNASNPTGTVRPVIGARPGTPVQPVANRPSPQNPGAVVRPVIGGRPGPGVMPFGTRPSVPGSGRGNATPAPRPTKGTVSLVPKNVANARPAGGLAFGGRPVPRAVTTDASGLPASRQSGAKPDIKPVATSEVKPGQRAKRMPRQGGPAVEGAIKRGARRRPSSRTPGQEVFAKFDAAKADEEAKKQPKHDTDPDSEWAIRTITVPAVITTRKAK
ncbi:hypothetical protein FB566_4150 [Stackebrandtia endophytica]|uniref:Uncharacterized protein n=1 Tax=Stackebrandtia endophytica TaxID=1496996 RepID=A0A543B161_9ACTN|nr:hypothetical protein [Stackebrandtia endophytica]TQL78561.1 hypothetical protein FB566_4150 [Stackebrandtia endophytica]